MSTISVKVEFGGGLELLFSNQRSHKVDIPATVPPVAEGKNNNDLKPAGRAADVTYLMFWLKDNLLKERPELFIENATVYVHAASPGRDLCSRRLFAQTARNPRACQ